MPRFMDEDIEQKDDSHSLIIHVSDNLPFDKEAILFVQSEVPLRDIVPWAHKQGLVTVEVKIDGQPRVLGFFNQEDLALFQHVMVHNNGFVCDDPTAVPIMFHRSA